MHVQLQKLHVVVMLSMGEPSQKLDLSFSRLGIGDYAGSGLKMKCVLIEIIMKGAAEDTRASAEMR